MTRQPSVRSSRRTRAVAVMGWSLIVTGCGHTLLVVASAITGPPPEQQRAYDAMVATSFSMGGLERSLFGLFEGFSLMMALFVVALGGLNLVLARRHPKVLASNDVLWLDLAVLVPALVLSVLLLPPPPIILISVAVLAVVTALRSPHDEDARPGSARPVASMP